MNSIGRGLLDPALVRLAHDLLAEVGYYRLRVEIEAKDLKVLSPGLSADRRPADQTNK
jgi:hypothetical protein